MLRGLVPDEISPTVVNMVHQTLTRHDTMRTWSHGQTSVVFFEAAKRADIFKVAWQTALFQRASVLQRLHQSVEQQERSKQEAMERATREREVQYQARKQVAEAERARREEQVMMRQIERQERSLAEQQQKQRQKEKMQKRNLQRRMKNKTTAAEGSMAGSQGGFGAGIDSAGIDAMVEQIQADERLEYTKQRQQEAEERVQMQSILAREMAMQAQEPLVVVEAEASSLLEHDASTSCRPAVDEFPLLSRCACQHRLDVSNEINLKRWPLRISVAGGLFVLFCFVLFCGRGLM